MSYAPSLYSNSSSLSRLPSETMPSSQHPYAIFKRPSSYRSQNMSSARSDQPVYRTSRTSSIPEASRRSQKPSSARLTPRDTYADGPKILHRLLRSLHQVQRIKSQTIPYTKINHERQWDIQEDTSITQEEEEWAKQIKIFTLFQAI